ncbi:MAG: hypothetical protein J6K55_08485 [Clostridia bacterium]|nr:hypothetical protein [Clostridia bacterium]
MDYKSKNEIARQLRDSVDTFLKKLASQDKHLEIVSRHINIAINYYDASVAVVFFRADSIRIKVSSKAMLQRFYAQLLNETIPCRYEYDDAHSIYGRTFIGVDAPYAQKALQSIILTVQNSKADKQDMNTAPRPVPVETESAMARPEESVSKSTRTPDVIIQPELSPVMVVLQESAAEVSQGTHEHAVPGISIDMQNEQETANDVALLEVHSVLTGKIIKMLVCADLRLGAVSAERLDMKQSHTWQATRNEKYADLIDKASQNNVAYVALWGQIFGQARVSESVIDALFQTIREEPSIVVIAFLDADEYKRISYRSDIPENLHLVNMQAQDSYLDERIALRVKGNAVELQLGDNDTIIASRDNTEHYVLNGIPGNNVIPSFEPIGFEDAQDVECGYGIVEWTEDKLGQFRVTHDSRYTYKAVEMKILPEDDEKEILGKINNLIRSIERDTFLRITLTGRSAFGLTISSDALKKQMQNRVFYVEVYDNTVMDIDEESFETDISLRSEFVRLALQDGSLSESERNRLISLGWNALSGREVSAE